MKLSQWRRPIAAGGQGRCTRAHPASVIIGVGICRDSKTFGGSRGWIGVADSATNIGVSLVNPYSILLGKCVCQLQTVYLIWLPLASPQTPTPRSPLEDFRSQTCTI